MSNEKKEAICFPFDSLEGINPIFEMELKEEESKENGASINQMILEKK